MSQTHWKKLTNPDYIGVYALTPGEDLTVTIKLVRRQLVKGDGGREQECTVVTLDKQKPLILNATNAKSLERLFGTAYIEDWAGKQFTLYESTTQLKGETVACLRIRPTVGAPKKKPITEDRFSKALAAIEAGSYSTEDLLEKYELTPEQLERMPKRIEAGESA